VSGEYQAPPARRPRTQTDLRPMGSPQAALAHVAPAAQRDQQPARLRTCSRIAARKT